ncbi:MAG: hypothetical protein PUG48_08840 [Clostridia bacterium]|nr:hypothetical protein [Clostridia bacterium]
MLCKNCENVIPDDETVCSYCGTSALDIQNKNGNTKKEYNSNRKRNRKKNRRNNVSDINGTGFNNTESVKSTAEPLCNMPQKFKPELEPPQNTPEMPPSQTEQPQNPPPPPQPEITKPPVTPQNDMTDTEINDSDVMSGIERVKRDSDLPKPDNRHTMSESTGIVYEIAEELYRKEKTASEIEALCQPPFKKVFSQKQIEELNRQAEEKTRTLVSSTVEPEKKETKPEPEPKIIEPPKEQSPISTSKAFLLQLVLFVPIVNIITALIFGFRKNSNLNMKAYSRAFCIWCVIVMAVSLVYISVLYFSDPMHSISIMNLQNLFKQPI